MRQARTSPALLRVREAGGAAPPLLDIEARWLTSGRRTRRTVRTADGLCVIPWQDPEEAVELTVRSVFGVAEGLVVPRLHRGRVVEVELHAETAFVDPHGRAELGDPSRSKLADSVF